MQQLARRVTKLLSGRKFFAIVLGFFVIEALWITFSAVYPQAFDEDFHFGLIKLYAHHWSPFLSGQPAGADAFGPVARDPSYLYHYLMSFPYRFIATFAHAQATQVILLRLINVALFGYGIVLFRRVLRRARVSAALVNSIVVVFVLIPVVPQLAAQINYDNLLLPLVAWTCLLVFDLIESLQRDVVDVSRMLALLSLCLLTSLVKYPYLPIFASAVLFLAAAAFRQFRGRATSFWVAVRRGFGRMTRPAKIGLIALVLLSAGLFFQRYGINAIRYHEPVPDCAQVLTVQQCSANPPWVRNYNESHNKQPGVITNPIIYTGEWMWGLWYRLFFAVNGHASGYVNYFPLPLPSAAAIILAVGGTAMVWAARRQIFRGNSFMLFFLVMGLFYGGALWLDDYKQFLLTSQPVAINGRYLLPILLPIGAIVGRAISEAVRTRPRVKPMLALAVLILFIEGGGIFTFIVRSDNSWYWNNPVVQRVNNGARRVVSPFLIKRGGKFY